MWFSISTYCWHLRLNIPLLLPPAKERLPESPELHCCQLRTVPKTSSSACHRWSSPESRWFYTKTHPEAAVATASHLDYARLPIACLPQCLLTFILIWDGKPEGSSSNQHIIPLLHTYRNWSIPPRCLKSCGPLLCSQRPVSLSSLPTKVPTFEW